MGRLTTETATQHADGRAPDRDPAWEVVVAELSSAIDWRAALPARAGGRWWRTRQQVKRAADVLLASAALVLLSPVLALIGLLVIADGGAMFYRWRVIGFRGSPFTGYKFRTMVPNADELKDNLAHLNEMTGPAFKIRQDPRVTRVGRFLRRHSLDELPQLWSVVRGDMSLVGPRPPSAREFVDFGPWQRLKLSVRPGLTCLWQVSGRADITRFDDWAKLDLQYIREWGLLLDLRLLVQTAWVVIRGTGGY